MPLKCEQLPGEPVLIFRFVSPSQPLLEAQQMHQYLSEARPSPAGVLYFISDFSQANISFSDVMIGMGEFSHKMVMDPAARPLKTAMVGTSEMIRLMADAAGQQQYGAQRVPCFSTLDEALAHIRSQIAAE